jgi:hypothetical protein
MRIILIIPLIVLQFFVIALSANGNSIKELRRIESQFAIKANKDLLRQSIWTIHHAGGPDCEKMLEELFVDVDHDFSFDVKKSIEKNGGVEKYKKRVASYLKSKDSIAKYLAVLTLGVINDKNYIDDIASLLNPETKGEMDDFGGALSSVPIGFALIALAMMEAQEYMPEAEKMARGDDLTLRKYAAQAVYIFKMNKYKRQYKEQCKSFKKPAVLENESELQSLIKKQANIMSKAMLEGDEEKLLEYIDPDIKAVIDADPLAMPLLSIQSEEMKDYIDKIEVIEISSLVSDGKNFIAGFITMNQTLIKEPEKIFKDVRIVFSNDKGKTWHFISLNKSDEIQKMRFPLLFNNVPLPNTKND